MKIKYLVSDLDGTLVIKKKINDEDIKSINKFIEDGNHFWVATGRGYDTFEYLKEYNLYPEEMVCSSGAVLCSNKIKPRYLSIINTEDTRHLFSFLEKNFSHLDYTLDINDHSLRFIRMDSGNLLRHLCDFPTKNSKSVEEIFNYPDLKLMRLFCVGDSNEYCAEVKKAIDKEFNGRLKALKTDDTCLDILPNECGKWNGLKTLLLEKNINLLECAAIGDEETDIEMIQNCGIGFAMHTADEKVKKSADYIVKSVTEAINIIRNTNEIE